MRYFITLILIITTFQSFSQTKLDSLILNEINDYRTSKGIKKVTFDTIAFRCASLQSDTISTYMMLDSGSVFLGHNNFGELKTPSDRFRFFGGDIRRNEIAEVCNFVSINVKNDSTYLQKIALRVVNSWKGSEEHNKILSNPEYNSIGVSSNKIDSGSPGVKTHTHYVVFSTAVLVK